MYKYSDLRSICANRLNAQKTIFEFVSMNHMMPFYTFQTTWNIAYWIILYSVCSFLICFRRFLISYSKKLYILWDVVFLYSILLDWVLLSLWWNSSLHETSVALSLLLACSLVTMALGCPIGGIDFTGKIISGIWSVEKEQEWHPSVHYEIKWQHCSIISSEFSKTFYATENEKQFKNNREKFKE